MTENKLLFGIGMIFLGIIAFYFFVIKEYNKKKTAWDIAMYFKGIVASFSLLLIGLVSLLIHFELI